MGPDATAGGAPAQAAGLAPARPAFLLNELDLQRFNGLVLLLATDASLWMTGAAIPVDGGHLCSSLSRAAGPAGCKRTVQAGPAEARSRTQHHANGRRTRYSRRMSDARTRLRALALPLCVAVPLGTGVLLNGLVRPFLADELRGRLVRRGASVRGGDRWWEFDEATRATDPVLTGFLQMSDGAVGMAVLGLAVLAVIGLWIVERVRRRGKA